MEMNLNQVPIRNMKCHEHVDIPKEFYEKTDVLEVSPVDLEFEIYQDGNQDDVLFLKAQGKFTLEDARTLEPVFYPFQLEMNEKIAENNEVFEKNFENSKNTLDIMAILWENIVLEIPISFTVSDTLEKEDEEHGWTVGEEKKDELDPRMAPLLGLLNKEKE